VLIIITILLCIVFCRAVGCIFGELLNNSPLFPVSYSKYSKIFTFLLCFMWQWSANHTSWINLDNWIKRGTSKNRVHSNFFLFYTSNCAHKGYGVLMPTLCDKVCQCLAASRWFSLGTPVSSTDKTDCYHITEILLKVALKHHNPYVHNYWELTTLVVIGTDCIGSYKTKLPYDHDHDGPVQIRNIAKV
jgi:hypothetical protein